MIKSADYSYSKTFIGFCFILLQLSTTWCHEFSPAVVKIYVREKYLCAGTFISSNFVLTSAECLELQPKASDLTVIRNEATLTAISAVVDMFKAPVYNKTARYMDVAMLKLKKSMDAASIQVAELCQESAIRDKQSFNLYFWNIERDTSLGYEQEDYSLKVLRAHAMVNNEFPATTFGVSAAQLFNDKGGPAVVDGKICGIYNFDVTCELQNTKNFCPRFITSLANLEVINFINESLKK